MRMYVQYLISLDCSPRLQLLSSTTVLKEREADHT